MRRTIPEYESKAVWRLFIYSLILASSYTLSRTAGDSLFLSRIGSESLAAIYVVSGIVTAFVASIWFALTRKFSLEWSFRASGIAFSLITFVAALLLPSFHHSLWLLAGIYLLADVKGCVNAINVVTAMNQILGGHSSRQGWARVGLGMPLAGILIGVLIGIEANWVSLRSWLFLSAALDLVGAVTVWNSSKLIVPKTSQFPRSLDAMSSIAERFSHRARVYASSTKFQFWIGCLIATKVAVLTMVSFEWKLSVHAVYVDDEESLTRFFGVFYAVTGVITVLLQAFVAGWLLKRRNIGLSILVMPVSLLAFNTLFVLGSGVLFLVVVSTLAKMMEVWRRSVHDTALGYLYTKIKREKRRRAIAWNSGLVKPLAEVSVSLVLLFGSGTTHRLTLLAATALWLTSTFALLRLIRKTQRRKKRTVALSESAAVKGEAAEPA
jgi:ATP/ADP translocase